MSSQWLQKGPTIWPNLSHLALFHHRSLTSHNIEHTQTQPSNQPNPLNWPNMGKFDMDVVLVRHAQAISNVVVESNEGGIDFINMEHGALIRLLEAVNASRDKFPLLTAKYGVYLPDGLTKEGQNSCEGFVESAREDPSNKLEVHRVYSSHLTRAVETAMRAIDKFNALDCHEGQPCIQTHSSIEEATNWPQDNQSPTLKASYILLQGGKGDDAGNVLGEITTDLSAVTCRVNDKNILNSPETRLHSLKVTPDFEACEEHAAGFRKWLYGQRETITRQWKAAGREGIPRVVVFLHGGIFNMLVGKWYCSYTRDDESSDWKWNGSTVLRNLEAAVFRFNSDDDATLEEVPRNAEYERIFGKYYRHLGMVEYTNPDGTVVDQRQGHKDFLERTAAEVLGVVTEKPLMMQALMNWTGADSAVKQLRELEKQKSK
ncbi:hypothetical protein EDB81DRAFT_771214 [Dactylonectria macrodidyma]|uniref:Phosphoglycerate mutase-like protein n=1 Tax=Dactylonectria macrodidyma TaxID=307937 RepID=A0A9P9FSV9_9HYPO|nr:hypothetical protein EDB81DRAFT_771214 [Dactylonectria macrodidyma]